MSVPGFQPAFSHGDPPGADGTVTGVGKTLGVAGCHPWFPPVMFIFVVGGTSAVVKVESNGGLLDATGNADSRFWADITGGGYTINAGDYKAINLSPQVPWHRTNIATLTGGGGIKVYGFIPLLMNLAGQVFSSAYPTFINKLPYNP